MRAMLDEAAVRRIVRQGIIRRMLAEGPPVGDPQGGGLGLLGSLLRMGADDSEEPEGAVKAAPVKRGTDQYGRVGSETTIQAIFRVATGRDTGRVELDPQTGHPYVGPIAGAAIVKMIEESIAKDVKSDFVPTNADSVMDEWTGIAESIEPVPMLDEKGEPSGEQMDFTPDEEGLLRYLVAIRAVEFGIRVSRAHYEAVEGIIKELSPTCEALREDFDEFLLDLVITDSNMKSAVGTLMAFIQQRDKDPSLAKTKMLLALFAARNTTAGEAFSGTAKGLGIVAGVVAIAAAIYLTGGLAAGALGGGGVLGASTVGGATGIAGASAAAVTMGSGLTPIAASVSGMTVVGAGLATGVAAIAAKGVIATGAAGIAGILGGIYSITWCGNKAIDASDEYMDFITILDTGEGIDELKGEFETVMDIGSIKTEKIRTNAVAALELIEMGGDDIRSRVLAYLKKAQEA